MKFSYNRYIIPTEYIYVNGITYKLDSCNIIDISGNHFCSLLTVGGEYCSFDGASYRRLSRFDWISKLGLDEDWTFDTYSKYGTQPKWNFRNGYQIFYYYRD